MKAPLITWRRTWPEHDEDYVAVVAGGSFGRIYRTFDNGLRQGEWVWSLTYPSVTGLTKAGRAKTRESAVQAVRDGLDVALRWHAERGEPLALWRLSTKPNSWYDPAEREPLRLVVGQDLPWPEGWEREG